MNDSALIHPALTARHTVVMQIGLRRRTTGLNGRRAGGSRCHNWNGTLDHVRSAGVGYAKSEIAGHSLLTGDSLA
jgi:hypothetical protein